MSKSIKGKLTYSPSIGSYYIKPVPGESVRIVQWINDIKEVLGKDQFVLKWKISSSESKLLNQDFKSSVLDYTWAESLISKGPIVAGGGETLHYYFNNLFLQYEGDKWDIWLELEVEFPTVPLDEYELMPTDVSTENPYNLGCSQDPNQAPSLFKNSL